MCVFVSVCACACVCVDIGAVILVHVLESTLVFGT